MPKSLSFMLRISLCVWVIGWGMCILAASGDNTLTTPKKDVTHPEVYPSEESPIQPMPQNPSSKDSKDTAANAQPQSQTGDQTGGQTGGQAGGQTSNTPDPESTPTTTENEAVLRALTAQVWQLGTLGGVPAVNDGRHTVTMTFGIDGAVHGNASCNQYNTSYTLEGTALSFAPGATTMMLCDIPQEDEFMNALGRIRSYQLTSGALSLFDERGTLLMTLVHRVNTPLEGNDWQVVSYFREPSARVSALAGTELTIRFEEGNVGGSSGCNRYFSTYTLSDNRLTLGPVASTRRLCPEDLMTQERHFLTALERAVRVELAGTTTTLWAEDGTRVIDLMLIIP